MENPIVPNHRVLSRRSLMVGSLGLSATVACRTSDSPRLAYTVNALGPDVLQPARDAESKLPPHCDALSLVWATQQDLIKQVEVGYAKTSNPAHNEGPGPDGWWWFDTVQRDWEVRRPFSPGFFDSTHWFTVRYLLHDKAVAQWFVDTREKRVEVEQKPLASKGAT